MQGVSSRVKTKILRPMIPAASIIMDLTMIRLITYMMPRIKSITGMRSRRNWEEEHLGWFSDALIIKIRSMWPSKFSKIGRNFTNKGK